MILVDTSIWIDHLRQSDTTLVGLLHDRQVLMHTFIIGELAMGQLRQRDIVLNAIANLPRATLASDDEMLHFINRQLLFGRGIGYVDAHLLAAVRLTPGTLLWTRDKRLHAVAAEMSLAEPWSSV